MKVSVIIPTYKGALYLRRAIDSVLKQTYKNIELIVVDDNNPDTEDRKMTEIVMSKYQNNRNILYIQHSQNKNASAARNSGFSVSEGDYIAFLDDDDEFLPHKIEVQLNKMESLDETWGACYTKFNEKRNFKIASTYVDNKEGYLLVDALSRNLLTASGSNLFVRRNVYEELNGFDETFLRNQDYEFLVRLLKKYKYAYCPELCLTIHMHKKSLDFEEITKVFIEKFDNDIKALSKINQDIIYRNLNLQLFKYYILSKKSLKQSYLLVRTKKVKLCDIVKYGIYLLYRYIFKVKKSFNLT